MRPQELTMAEVFKANGYVTGMLGKWHLGDSYPSRPMDQGFDHAIYHHDGCIGGGPDYWENDYFDDHYMTKAMATCPATAIRCSKPPTWINFTVRACA